MRRREFITLVGGVATWPLAAHAQQGEKMRLIGALMPSAADDVEGQARIRTFVQALQQLGWSDGHNVRIDIRWAAGNPNNLVKYATELVALAPDVILAGGTPTLGPLLRATRTVPIIFVHVPDPVGAGFVDSLARPGGNATGFTLYEYGIGAKWLELLKEAAPRITRAAIIRDPELSSGIGLWAVIQTMASSVAIEVIPVNPRSDGEIERALTGLGRSSNGGLIVTGSALARFIAI